VTGRKPIDVLLQSISGVSTIIPLVAFYDIHGGKRGVLFFCSIPDTTRDNYIVISTFQDYIVEICFITLSTIILKCVYGRF
jgi:hypothetical protein